MGKLDGKVAIITGGARGQGEAEVRRFVAEGRKVVFGDVLDDLGEKVAADLGDDGDLRPPRRPPRGRLDRPSSTRPRIASAASTCSSTTPAS